MDTQNVVEVLVGVVECVFYDHDLFGSLHPLRTAASELDVAMGQDRLQPQRGNQCRDHVPVLPWVVVADLDVRGHLLHDELRRVAGQGCRGQVLQ